jgi:XTP/dITP diphosphohydrolase
LSSQAFGLPATVLVATRNPGKLRELRPLFAALGVRVVDLGEAGVPESDAEEAVEAHETFEENALAKARHFSRASGGLATVADDSGLEVDALGGAPGVRSKRFSGETGPGVDAANNALLVERLGGVEDRTARFVCAAAYVDGARELVRRGSVPGRIVDEGRGAHGFGYDPHFLADELGKTFGEATVVEKGGVSHRARAFAALVEALAAGSERGERRVGGGKLSG